MHNENYALSIPPINTLAPSFIPNDFISIPTKVLLLLSGCSREACLDGRLFSGCSPDLLSSVSAARPVDFFCQFSSVNGAVD